MKKKRGLNLFYFLNLIQGLLRNRLFLRLPTKYYDTGKILKTRSLGKGGGGH